MSFIRLDNIISAEDVSHRWSVDSWTLGEITRHDKIAVYGLRDTRSLSDGSKIYLCDSYWAGMPYEEDFGKRIYDLSLYVFNLVDIIRYETAHPEYLLPRVPEDEREYIPAKEMQKDFRLSPVQFVDYLREHRDLAFSGNGVDEDSRRWFYHSASREQAADMLDDMYIHRLDIETHKKCLAEKAISSMEDAPLHFPEKEPETIGSALLQSQWVEIEPYITLSDLLERWECDITHINEMMLQNVIGCYEVRGWTGFHENIPKGIKRAATRGLKKEDQWRRNVGSFVFPLTDIDKYEASASAQQLDFMKVGPLFPSERRAFKKLENRIAELEASLVEAQKQNGHAEEPPVEWAELHKNLKEKDARITELETQLTEATAEPTTTVNAAMWENSVKAAFMAWAQIFQGDKTDWKEKEFQEAVLKHGMGCHTKVLTLAWSLLPSDDFKHGKGRPKKNPKKSQQSDNS